MAARTSRADETVGGGTIATRGVVAAVIAAIVNGVLVVVVPLAIDHPPFPPLSLQPVLLFTVIGVVGATLVYWILRRLMARPDRTFAIVAAVVLLLSFVPDLTFARTLPGATTAGIVLLMVMHVVAAAVSVGVLTRGIDGIA